MLQSKSDRRSSEEKSNVAVVSTVEWSGPEWIVVVGGQPGSGGRISHSWLAGVGSGLPDASTDRTWNRCLPTSRMALCGLSQSSQSLVSVFAGSTGSKRHWKAMVLELSCPSKRNDATSFLVVAGGPSRSTVLGGFRSEPPGPPSQRTLKHCCGVRVSGSSGPTLPWALLPPPSTFVRPLLPSLAQIPHVPLSLAVLPVIVWLTFGTWMP